MIAFAIPTAHFLTPVVLAGVFVLLLGLEWALPLRRRVQVFRPRVITNAVMSAGAFAAGVLAVRPVAMWVIGWSAPAGFGVLRALPVGPWARLVLGFLLMDLTFYYWHLVNHRVGVLWRFHSVHHVDGDMDVTTSFRFHVVEILYSAGFRALQVGLLGVSMRTYLVYEAVFQAATMFHHSNMRIPIGLERLLNLIFVTPRMHGVHHSIVRREVNSNYSTVFRFWDWIHRSLILNVPQADITIGVAGYLACPDNTIGSLLLMPFSRQRRDRAPEGHAAESRGTGPPTAMAE